MARPGKPVRRGGKDKPPTKGSMEAKVAKKLSEGELSERGRRLARKQVELAALRRRKKAANRAINEELSDLAMECDKLAEEIVHGEEMVRQGDLFAPKYQDGGAPTPPAKTKEVLAEVGKRAGETPPPAPPGPAAA